MFKLAGFLSFSPFIFIISSFEEPKYLEFQRDIKKFVNEYEVDNYFNPKPEVFKKYLQSSVEELELDPKVIDLFEKKLKLYIFREMDKGMFAAISLARYFREKTVDSRLQKQEIILLIHRIKDYIRELENKLGNLNNEELADEYECIVKEEGIWEKEKAEWQDLLDQLRDKYKRLL
ncbi:13357_t:CDS:1 [Ambispora leptoticha]|uniref:13357_t:CDS:1 n=1 Tax=Ambispora leptoticha TaxID=144679 RepID=A0A9N9BBM7_9GLOM|nr:13357_t:CDS:1 [Ambispora leptoticha]